MRPSIFVLLFAAATPALQAQTTSRGVQLFESHDRAGARAEFVAAVQRNDRDARAHYYLGRLALLENDANAAAEHLERAAKLDEKVTEYHLWHGNAIAQQAPRASKLRMPMLGKRAMAALERAVALDANNIEARDVLVDFYSMAPGFMGGGADKALAQAQAIARIDAMRGHVALGRLAMRSKDGATVERELNAAIAAAPDSIRAYSTLVSWYVREKAWPEAFATMDRFIRQSPDDPYGLYQVGRIAALSGEELTRGEQSLRSFLKNPPGDAAPPMISRAYLRLGQVLEHQGKGAEGRGAIEQAVKLDPRNDEAKKALK